jgi:cation transport regulator ChaC
MSLWTPDGEHRVEREQPSAERGPEVGEDPLADLSPEEREQAAEMAAEMEEVRRQLASVPAAVVVANHAMGLYELAAIHLSSQPPNFAEAQLAIDAMAAIAETLRGRLGENEATLHDALNQLRMAYVQLKGASADPGAASEG